MPAYFEEGFSVHKPMWHSLGKVLDEYPSREVAQPLAGHAFTVVDHPVFTPEFGRVPGFRALVKDYADNADHADRGQVFSVVPESRGYVQPDLAWDVVDAFVKEGAKYETGITLKGGAVCSVLAWLDEPATVPGDDSTILPWINVAWGYDGTQKFAARPTSIRTVCWNTQSAAEAQGRAFDLEFEFKNTSRIAERVEDAKMAIAGLRVAHQEYLDLAGELATMPISERQRELFVCEFIPMPPEALISDRVAKNVEEARGAVRALFDGPTIPGDHRFTAYGLHLAGGEYLDHLRGYRNPETKFNRSILRREPAKAKLTKLIREVAVA